MASRYCNDPRYKSDPFAGLEDEGDGAVRQEIQELCNQVMAENTQQQWSVDEYVGEDSDLAFFFEADDDHWDTDFFSVAFPTTDVSH